MAAVILGIFFILQIPATILITIFISLSIIAIITFIVFFIKNKKSKKINLDDLQNKEKTASISFQKSNELLNEVNNNLITGKTTEKIYNKKSLLTEAEKSLYTKLVDIIDGKYIIESQVNLASIINKQNNQKYCNELFRNIDFGIFDKATFEIKVLIELNDQSHNTWQRSERDKKVKKILYDANIPLITLWTKFDNEKEYIKNRLKNYIEL